MATVTAQVIIDNALRKNGVQQITATQQANALIDLNNLLGLWNVDGLMIPYTTNGSHTLVSGTGSYTIGSGADINTSRPIKIISAFVRDSSNVDTTLEVNMTVQEYNDISQKSTTGRPDRLFYLPGYPNGTIYFDYVPDAAYTFVYDSEKSLTEIATVGTTVNMADEFKMALTYNLAVMISSDFGILDEKVIAMANASKAAIERNNIRVTPARYDRALRGSEPFNINSG
jgi:hypothetical protein